MIVIFKSRFSKLDLNEIQIPLNQTTFFLNPICILALHCIIVYISLYVCYMYKVYKLNMHKPKHFRNVFPDVSVTIDLGQQTRQHTRNFAASIIEV